VQLVWAAMLGALVFDEAVDGFVLTGGAMIILAITAHTVFEARRERVVAVSEP